MAQKSLPCFKGKVVHAPKYSMYADTQALSISTEGVMA